MSDENKVETFRLAEGELYAYKCLGCGNYNGGGILNDWHTREQAESDPYCPINQPCVHCDKGPVVIELSGVHSTGEIV